jgi:hypothetical protein
MVQKWYAHDPVAKAQGSAGVRGYLRDASKAIRRRNREELADLYLKLRGRYLKDPMGNPADAERAIFAEEVEDLREYAPVQPRKVADPNAPDVLKEIQDLSPYLMLSLGGPLYRARLFKAFRGLCLNQHAGWSPDLRGSGTITRALYHRRTDWLGSTVHIHDTGADSGPILRRSLVTVTGTDTPAEITMRVVALGTELMIDAVADILSGDSVTVFPQPSHGRTITRMERSPYVTLAVSRDLKAGWLPWGLSRERVF